MPAEIRANPVGLSVTVASHSAQSNAPADIKRPQPSLVARPFNLLSTYRLPLFRTCCDAALVFARSLLLSIFLRKFGNLVAGLRPAGF
jgi:hypothetical protein